MNVEHNTKGITFHLGQIPKDPITYLLKGTCIGPGIWGHGSHHSFNRSCSRRSHEWAKSILLVLKNVANCNICSPPGGRRSTQIQLVQFAQNAKWDGESIHHVLQKAGRRVLKVSCRPNWHLMIHSNCCCLQCVHVQHGKQQSCKQSNKENKPRIQKRVILD